MANLHVVLGAGQIGPLLSSMLLERGERVRVVRRSSASESGIEVVSADVRDPEVVARVTDGAAVVYHCVNPVYHQWGELLLPQTRGIVEGTKKSGARLVALDNLYMYGDNRRMGPDTAPSPRSKKGELRQRAAELMLAHPDVAIGRAADFFGPRGSLATIFGERFYRRVLAGKPGECFGDPDLPHSYAYTPDVARGLAALGASDVQGIWMLPAQPAETTREVMTRFYRAFDVDLGVSRVPTWVLRAMGVFNPIVREVVEMLYQWEQPYVIDDSKTRALLGIEPTPWDEAITATVRWARATYAPRAAA